MSLLQLTYISRATERFGPRDLPGLIDQAATNNATADVTGALYFASDRFIQVLEGPEDTVRSLVDRISRDPRHTDLEVVAAKSIPTRRFAAWSMGALSPSLAARAAKEAFRVSDRGVGWSGETLEEILSQFERALAGNFSGEERPQA
jgi:hypothetical protein